VRQWGQAKGRINSELGARTERKHFASDYTGIGVLENTIKHMSDTKTGGFNRDQNSFLNSSISETDDSFQREGGEERK
jgi:hypothetical protein